MVCHHLNVGAKAKLAKELYLLIVVKSTLAHDQSEFKNGIDLVTSVLSFKINVLGTLDIYQLLKN
jgi:hypothetical protein